MDILKIEIQTDNLTETAAFYGDVLGLKPANRQENSVSFLAGRSILTFIKSTKANPTYHFAFNIPNNKLNEAILWAKSRLSLIENDEKEIVSNFESWNAKAIYFYDNNKNIIEFIARFDLDNSAEKPFDSSSIQSISEIGLVTDKPLKLAEKLVAENNICFFAKGAKSEKFVTVGDDNGLFIIVETNRKWYPTELPAGKHFVKISIASGGSAHGITLNA